MNEKIWLSSPHMSGHEMKYISQAFEYNWIAPVGSNIDGFERDLEEYLGENSYVTALNSGTAAIHLALILLGVGKDDFVICQSLTFVASVNPVIYQHAIPVLVDSEEQTLNMCPNALEDAIKYCLKMGKKPKAIITICLYGMPYRIDEIGYIANKYDIPIIEDAAEALGSTYKGKKCGTFGDISVISFNGNKIITTSGGGVLISRSKEINTKALFLATQAKDIAPYYEHSKIGYNYRMSNICAGIGRGQMEVLELRLGKRRHINDLYRKKLKCIEGLNVFDNPSKDYHSNFWLTTIFIDSRLKNIVTVDMLRIKLLERNIESRPLWKPMHLQPLFRNFLYFGKDIAQKGFESGLCLPSGSSMSEKDIDIVTTIIKESFIF